MTKAGAIEGTVSTISMPFLSTTTASSVITDRIEFAIEKGADLKDNLPSSICCKQSTPLSMSPMKVVASFMVSIQSWQSASWDALKAVLRSMSSTLEYKLDRGVRNS
jgi:hypothetical protein